MDFFGINRRYVKRAAEICRELEREHEWELNRIARDHDLIMMAAFEYKNRRGNWIKP